MCFKVRRGARSFCSHCSSSATMIFHSSQQRWRERKWKQCKRFFVKEHQIAAKNTAVFPELQTHHLLYFWELQPLCREASAVSDIDSVRSQLRWDWRQTVSCRRSGRLFCRFSLCLKKKLYSYISVSLVSEKDHSLTPPDSQLIRKEVELKQPHQAS